jgi:hypothetical protein
MGASAYDLRDDLDTLGAALERAGFPGQESRVLRATTAFLEAQTDAASGRPAPVPLDASELAALDAVGAREPAEVDQGPILSVAARHAALVAASLPLAEAASRLGVNPSRLRQRLSEGSLVGIRDPGGRSWLIPLFQLMEEGELPGLRTVLRTIRRDARPVEVLAFFETAQPDLEDDDGEAMTPRAWLRRHGDPSLVAELAQEV